MREDILQYIWKFRYYNSGELFCTNANKLQILSPGNHNSDQGPDFLQARIKINDTIWAGSIEIHVRSSQWKQHRHSGDSNYENVVLHVVWNHDLEIEDISGNDLPVLELQGRVPGLLLDKYNDFMRIPVFIPCENNVHPIGDLSLQSWKQRLVIERLIERSEIIFENLRQANNHWEEVFWWLLAANFGLKVNNSTFEKIARSLPLNILIRHKYNLIQLEALLFGQAGLLRNGLEDKYAIMLKKEYSFLRKKYQLIPVEGHLHFLRMRPANFPTLRLAQLAQLISQSQHLFSKIKDAASLKEVRKMFDVVANDYWNTHYVFDKETEFKEKRLGKQMIENILINTVVPVLFAFGVQKEEDVYKEKAIAWLEESAAEKNRITSGFVQLSFENKNALDSQALMQLKNRYCDDRLCLQCAVGNSILKRSIN